MPVPLVLLVGLPLLPFEPPECRPLESDPCDFLDAADADASPAGAAGSGGCLLARSSDTGRSTAEDARSAAAFDCRAVRDDSGALGANDAERSAASCCGFNSGRSEASDRFALTQSAAFECRPFCFPALRDRRAAQVVKMSLSRDCDLDRLARKRTEREIISINIQQSTKEQNSIVLLINI